MADNLKNWIEQFEERKGQTVQKIVIGQHYDDKYAYEEDHVDKAPPDMINKVLTREVGLTILDLDYDSGYGGADCFPFYAWTEDYVLFVAEYDGSTRLGRIPRNPIDVEPGFQ
jgi:hypothetical protein